MEQAGDSNSRADQEGVIDTSSYDLEDVIRREDEVTRRLDAIDLELSRIFQEDDEFDNKYDTLILERDRIDQEIDKLTAELDDIYALSPTDQNEDVDTSTNDKQAGTWRRADAIDHEISRLHQELADVVRRSDAVLLEQSQLDREKDALRQEEAVLKQEEVDLRRKWEELLELNQKDDEEDVDTDEGVDTITEEDDSSGELEDDMSLALNQMVSSLCSICRNLAKGRSVHQKSSERAHRVCHPSLSSLKSSVDAGCPLCGDVRESLEKFCKKSDPPITIKEFWSIEYTVSGEDSYLELRFYLCQCELVHPAGTGCDHGQYLQSMAFYPARKLRLGPEFLDPTLRKSSAKSAASLNVARSWYRQCLNHATCRNWRKETRVLPTRLIQIRRPDSQMPDLSARIHETKDLPTSTPYATLSHCWGKGVIFKLLEKNLKDLSLAIPIDQLPKVFQDAIYVSFELGISYLWVDSLCIIQDSKDDWTHEAKRMGDVYLHGEFNIAATGYEDGLSGLFSERKALPIVHPSLCVDFVQVDKKLKKKTAYKGIYIRLDSNEFFQQITGSPLLERAWVAQERVLSAAIIHYTPGKIWWECNQEIFSEAITESPYVDGRFIWEKTDGSGRERIRSLSAKSKREDIYSFWNTFISSYSHCAMTFNRDRFPAVTGIARILAELVDDDFIAGFWSGDLIRSLMMHRLALGKSIQDEQLAPSWSWASSTAGIDPTMLDEVDVSQLEILDGVRIIRVLSDIPGFKSDLRSTSFEKSGVRGLVIRGALRRLPNDSETKPEWMQRAYLTYDNKTPCKIRGKDNIPEDQKWRLKDPTHALFLAKANDKLFHLTTDIKFYGILVQMAEVSEANTFHRSGQINIRFSEEEKWAECLGLGEKDDGYDSSLGVTERGLQDVVLI